MWPVGLRNITWQWPQRLGTHPAAPAEIKGKVLGETSSDKGSMQPSFHSLIFLLFCGLPVSKGVFNRLQLVLVLLRGCAEARAGQDSAWSWGTTQCPAVEKCGQRTWGGANPVGVTLFVVCLLPRWFDIRFYSFTENLVSTQHFSRSKAATNKTQSV